jgi:hypothetical protein
VGHEVRARAAGLGGGGVQHGQRVGGQRVDDVVAHARRAVAVAVAALVRRPDAQAGGRQRGELSPPAQRGALGEAVQQDHRLAASWAGAQAGQAHAGVGRDGHMLGLAHAPIMPQRPSTGARELAGVHGEL